MTQAKSGSASIVSARANNKTADKATPTDFNLQTVSTSNSNNMTEDNLTLAKQLFQGSQSELLATSRAFYLHRIADNSKPLLADVVKKQAVKQRRAWSQCFSEVDKVWIDLPTECYYFRRRHFLLKRSNATGVSIERMSYLINAWQPYEQTWSSSYSKSSMGHADSVP